MATPLTSVGGLASGLDTTSIVSQLMQLERQPVVRFQQRQTELRKVDDAWGQVTTKLSAMRSAADKLSASGALTPQKLTSSNADAVGVTANGTPATGAVSFTVSKLAAAHQITAGGSFASKSATVGAGTFSLVATTGGATKLSVTTDATTTVEQLATKINQADAGFTAQAVQVADGDVRLLISSSATGEAGRFSVANSSPAAVRTTSVLATGEDAVLNVGTLALKRSSNTVDDLLAGTRVELKAVTTSPVTISSQLDTATAVTAVKGLVDAVNGVLSTVKTLSSYDATSKKSNPLTGDDTARKLVGDLRAAVSGAVRGLGSMANAGAAGISLDRYGAVQFDEAKFTKALQADPELVNQLFNRAGTATDAGVRFASATGKTTPGQHTLVVTQAATTAGVTGANYNAPNGQPRNFTVTQGSTSVNVSIPAGTAVGSAVNIINVALRQNGITTLTAGQTSDGSPNLTLTESRYGPAGNFAVSGSGSFGLDGTHTGLNVAGTIDGQAATGSGQRLTATTGTGQGLAVDVLDTTLGPRGTVRSTAGLAAALQDVLTWAEGDKTSSDAATAAGAVSRARTTLTDEIKRFDDRISDFEVRLASRETTLRKKYAALESALSNLQGKGSWLSSQLG